MGILPSELVAWRWTGGWEQVPVQVDERDVRDFGQLYQSSPTGATSLVYTDEATFTGPDSNLLLDADDQIVVMLRDTGSLAPTIALPPGALEGTGVRIRIADPVDGEVAHVYLFRQDGSLDPAAGRSYVDYDFLLLSGDYLSTYNLASGPNPESTTVTTASYAHHFSDRWIDDEMRILAGDASGADILDRHKNQFSPGVCSRTENTFSNGEGAFVANRSGPVRAIRSYLGANSGPLTQREHLFYEARQDVLTALRVHPISGVVDFFDYSPAAAGMTYFNDRNLAGVPVDGSPDVVTAGALSWEMVTGPQGTAIILHRIDTDVQGLAVTSYYLDATAPLVNQCTGDPFAYGASGPWLNSPIPCTDPIACAASYKRLLSARTIYYSAPGGIIADAESLRLRADTPIEIAVTAWPPAAPGATPSRVAEGVPLLLAKHPAGDGRIDLSWGAGCGAGVVAYAVYEGAVGDGFRSHAPVHCSVPDSPFSLTPSPGDRYYLVVPVSLETEGSYGVSSEGTERLPPAAACLPQLLGACP